MASARSSGKHQPYEWASEPVGQHLLRASKHCATALEILEGYRKDDPESAREHLCAAIARASMALAKMEREERK
jgi:hypothetical protein